MMDTTLCPRFTKQYAEPQEMRRCAFEAPNRVWFQTENGWGSREWREGERAEYSREVLGR